MRKFFPSWKVYQGWMGCDSTTESIALCKMAVNNKYDTTKNEMSNF